MYTLFKLARLISVKEDVNPVTITSYAWRQHGESSLLALACSNGFIVLRYSCTGQAAVVKQLAWPSDHPIVSMCFDPAVSWLLVQTNNGDIFIIPALAMLDPSSQVNQLWRLDDVTIITSLKPRGTPTVIIWWQTLDHQQIAIIATRLGEILFMNLETKQLVAEVDVKAVIRSVELVQDDEQTTTHLLMTAKSGQQWKMMLEKRGGKVASTDSELSELGYTHMDGLNLPIISILSQSGADEAGDLFQPQKFDQFSRSVTLSPQNAKGRHFVAAHCDKNSTFQVYDSNIEHCPLFVYALPVGSIGVIFTDRILFTASKLGGDQKLLILSNQRAETSQEDEQEFNKDAILQQFELPPDEKLLTILPKSFPFYWHEKLEEQQIKLSHNPDGSDIEDTSSTKVPSALGIHLSSHTVLDGCIIITNSTVYECRPGISPERLFLELCVNQSDAVYAEQLGISLSLDLNFLFEKAADFLLCHGNSKQAARLFHMSKGSPIKRVSSFAKYGYIEEIMPFLQQLLSKGNVDVSPEERRQLTDLALHGLVYRLKQDTHNEEINRTLKQFLMNMFDHEVDLTSTLQLLAEAGLETILVEFAMARGLIIEALEIFAQQGHYTLTNKSLDLLVNQGFGAHLAQVGSGAFLQCLDLQTLVTIFCEKPQLVVQYPDLLLGNLKDLDIGALLRLANVLDPSRPMNQGLIRRKLNSRRRTSSLTSLTGSGEFGLETGNRRDNRSVDVWPMVHCFFMVVLHLNFKRQQNGTPVDTEFLFTNPTDFLQTVLETSLQRREKLVCKPNPIGCGHSHTAIVKHDDLFTWGKCQHGRLGHGEQKGNQTTCSPCKVGMLNMLQIRVISVACGDQHTIAITQQGIYGWGSSKYGQVGTNTRHTYTRPMLVEELSKVTCVMVDCGQYHSLALTDDAQVYSWGWGVHGQLGHGDIEDGLVPRLVSSLGNQSIVKIAAGYCHSLTLNTQGEVYTFGCGFFGQLGLGTTIKHTTPVKIHTLMEKIFTMSTKYFHSVAVATNNCVYQWGSHPHGLRHFVHNQRRARQAGQSTFEVADGHLKPKLVDTLYVHGKIKQVVCGSFHSCIVTKDGDVYTWGRNIDGQLGNGTRQDVPTPQMITQINDRHVTHLTSGGEFNVAMDTENQVWVWGRNEFGQLGLTGSDARMSSKMMKSLGSKQIHQNLTEVLTPVPIHFIPSPSLGDGFSISESLIRPMSIIEEGDDDDIDADDQTLALANLSIIGSMQYDRIVIPVVLQSIPSICDCNQFLRECVDMKDWCLATSINLHLLNYTQAFGYHLLHLRESRSGPDNEDMNGTSVRIFRHYYGLVVKKNTAAAPREVNIRELLYQVLYHWEMEGIPMSVLEECLWETPDHTACLLATIIFKKSSKEMSKEEKTDEEKPTLTNPSLSFLAKFSTKFCVKVTSVVLQKLSEDDTHMTQPSAFTSLKQLGAGNFGSLSESMLDRDKLPYDQIWQDIMQNLQKGFDVRQYIYVTHSELDRLESQLGDTDPSQAHKTPAIFFTCGHYYTKLSFTKEVDKYCQELRLGPVKVPETVSVLSKYYSSKGCVPLACPKCVFNAITSVSG